MPSNPPKLPRKSRRSDAKHDTPNAVLLPIAAACSRIGCGRTTLYRLLADGSLRARKIGRRTLIEAASVVEFAEAAPVATFEPGSFGRNRAPE